MFPSQTPEYRREYYQNNKEKYKEAFRKRYEENREELLAKARQWKEDNREHCAEYNKRKREERQYDPELFVRDVMDRVRESARTRDLELDIDKDYIRQLLIESNGVCSMSGVKLSTMHNDPNKASIDRIDSSKGYIKGNVRVVATRSNLIKNKWSDAEILEWALTFVQHHGYKVSK
jgi:hypothetical protein